MDKSVDAMQRDLLTIRVGVEAHKTSLVASGNGDAILSPDGWSQNWFSKVSVDGARQSVSSTCALT